MRTMIKGHVVGFYGNIKGKSGTEHANYGVDLDGDGRADVTFVYQIDFGAIPQIQNGAEIVACGDYITDHSFDNLGLIHWTHSNDGAKDHGTCKHPDGYAMVNGIKYGVSPPGKGMCH